MPATCTSLFRANPRHTVFFVAFGPGRFTPSYCSAEGWWTSDLVWTLWRENVLPPPWRRTMDCHCTDWAIPTPHFLSFGQHIFPVASFSNTLHLSDTYHNNVVSSLCSCSLCTFDRRYLTVMPNTSQLPVLAGLIPLGTFTLTRTLCPSLLQRFSSMQLRWNRKQASRAHLVQTWTVDWRPRETAVTSWIPRSYLAVACTDQERHAQGDCGA